MVAINQFLNNNNGAIDISNGIGSTTVVTSSYVDYNMNEILIEKLASRNYIHVYFNGKNTYNGTYTTTINYKTAPSTCDIALKNSTYNTTNRNGEVGYYEVFACNKILTTASSYTPDWTKRFMEDEFNNKYIIDQGDQLYGKEK